MSFEIFLAGFRNGEPEPLPHALVEAAFAGFIEAREPNSLSLRFPDGGYCEVNLFQGALSVNRPPLSPEFWRGLFDILKETPSLLFWPGGGVVARADEESHLPNDLADALGVFAVVTAPEQILPIIEKS